MRRTERWWAGALWLLVLELVMGTVPTPVEAASPSAAPVSTAKGEMLVTTVQVAGPVVNLWAGPSLAHAVQGQVRQGDELQVTGISADGQWLQAAVDGASRWIHADLTDMEADERRGLSVVAVPPMTFEGKFANRAEHWEDTYTLYQWGSTIGAVFSTTRSAVPASALRDPEILFAVPEGFRPALNVEWEIQGRAVNDVAALDEPQPAPRLFTARVSTDGAVHHLDHEQFKWVAYVRYTARLAWPRAGTVPNVCDHHVSIKRTLVSGAEAPGLLLAACPEQGPSPSLGLRPGTPADDTGRPWPPHSSRRQGP